MLATFKCFRRLPSFSYLHTITRKYSETETDYYESETEMETMVEEQPVDYLAEIDILLTDPSRSAFFETSGIRRPKLNTLLFESLEKRPLEDSVKLLLIFKERLINHVFCKRLIMKAKDSPKNLNLILEVMEEKNYMNHSLIASALINNSLDDLPKAVKIITDLIGTNTNLPAKEVGRVVTKLIENDEIEMAFDLFCEMCKIKIILDNTEIIRVSGEKIYNNSPLAVLWLFEIVDRYPTRISSPIVTQTLSVCHKLQRYDDFFDVINVLIENRYFHFTVAHFSFIFDVIYEIKYFDSDNKRLSYITKLFDHFLGLIYYRCNIADKSDTLNWDLIYQIIQKVLDHSLRHHKKKQDQTSPDYLLNFIKAIYLLDVFIPFTVFAQSYFAFFGKNRPEFFNPIIRLLEQGISKTNDKTIQLDYYYKIITIYSSLQKNSFSVFQIYYKLLYNNLNLNLFIYSQFVITALELDDYFLNLNDNAIHFINSAHNDNFQFTPALYCKIIDHFMEANYQDKIPEIISKLQPDSILIRQKIENKLIGSITEISDFEVSSPEYNELKNVLEKFMILLYRNKCNTAMKFITEQFEEMNLQKLPTFIECSFIRCIGKNKSLDFALKYFSENIEKLNIYHYEAIIDVLHFHSKYHDILSLYDKIISIDIDLIPTINIFNHVYDCIHKTDQNFFKLSKIEFKRKTLKVPVNANTINILTSIYVDLNKFESAELLIIREANKVPPIRASTTLIEKYVQDGRFEKAYLFVKSLPFVTYEIVRPIIRNISSASNIIQGNFISLLYDKNLSSAEVYFCGDSEEEGKNFVNQYEEAILRIKSERYRLKKKNRT